MSFNHLSEVQKQRIIELFLCSDDRRLKTISSIVGVSEMTVSNVVQDFYDGKITFERGNFKIYNSEINKF